MQLGHLTRTLLTAAALSAAALTAPLSAQNPSVVLEEVPTVVYSGKTYYKYTVRPKDTMYSLSRDFGLTQEELVANNPFLKKGLKQGQLLLIPVRKTPSDAPAAQAPTAAPTAPSEKPAQPQDSPAGRALDNAREDDFFVNEEVSAADPFCGNDTVAVAPRRSPAAGKQLSMALLLPFNLADTTPAGIDRYVEYYEGTLLAIDTLRRLGVSVDLAVYDIGKTRDSLNRVLARQRFNGVDFIVAAATNAQMSELSRWMQLHKKTLVLPFSSRIAETASNPYIYQVNAPKTMAYGRLAAQDTSVFHGKKIFLLRTPSEEKDERQQLFASLKQTLRTNHIPYNELSDATLKADDGETYQDILEPLLSADSVNLIVPAPTSLTEANRIISLVLASSNGVRGSKVELWGYPEWIALNKSNLPSLHKMRTTIYGTYFADFTADDVRNFIVRYSLAFGRDMLNTHPRYALMSYDVTLYFAGQSLGCDLGIAPLQHDLDFVRPSETGGWYNQTLYRIHYHPDRSLTTEAVE